MSNAKRNTMIEMHDERDVDNAFKFATNDSIHNAMYDALMQRDVSRETTNATNVMTLKQLMKTHNIKCDSKLIRRVLRKYYASKMNHVHRDMYVFNESQQRDVVELIDKHCRSMKSSSN